MAGFLMCLNDSVNQVVPALCLRRARRLTRFITSRSEPCEAAISATKSASFKTTFMSAATRRAMGNSCWSVAAFISTLTQRSFMPLSKVDLLLVVRMKIARWVFITDFKLLCASLERLSTSSRTK